MIITNAEAIKELQLIHDGIKEETSLGPSERDKRQMESRRADRGEGEGRMNCPNCGKPGAHFVPPSCGEPGFFICDMKTIHEPAPSAATETPSFELTEACLKSHGLSDNMANVVYGELMGAKRELAAKTAELEGAKERANHLQSCLTQDNDKLDAMTQRCERLEKALKEIADCPGKYCVTCQTKARVALQENQTMKASELIEAKQTYDELKAHFETIVAREIMVELQRKGKLPRDGNRPEFNAGVDAAEAEIKLFLGKWL